MTWAPGQSGNPKGYAGPRERRRKEVFELIKGLGHKDALETLSYLQHNEQIEPVLRIAAASALAPYCHPKMQATPTPRFIELQLDVPEFTHVSEAEDFLAKIAIQVARGVLDIQQGQELSAMIKDWISIQYAKEELQFKISPPETRDTTITITGGLPALPGTNIRRDINDERPLTNGHALEPPNEFPTPGEAKATGPHPLQEHHFEPVAADASPDEPGKNSTNGGQEP